MCKVFSSRLSRALAVSLLFFVTTAFGADKKKPTGEADSTKTNAKPTPQAKAKSTVQFDDPEMTQFVARIQEAMRAGKMDAKEVAMKAKDGSIIVIRADSVSRVVPKK